MNNLDNLTTAQRILDYETAYGNVEQWSNREKNRVARILGITTDKLNKIIEKIKLYENIEEDFSRNPILLSDEEEKKLLKPTTYNISKKRKRGGSRSHKRKNKRSNKFRKN